MQQTRRQIVLGVLLFAGLTGSGRSYGQAAGVSTLEEMFRRIRQCWKPPPLSAADPGMQITVLVSFKRDGQILGRPRVTFESADASDTDRIVYRTAVMEALQRCAPMPFINGMGDSIAGRPMTIKFDDRRNLPQTKEKRAWLTTKIL